MSGVNRFHGIVIKCSRRILGPKYKSKEIKTKNFLQQKKTKQSNKKCVCVYPDQKFTIIEIQDFKSQES